MSEVPPRRLREDARLNSDRLLDAATRAFARDGADASLKAIAAEAGVGIGTLYRRYPTREQLVWAVYRGEVERVCALVDALLAQSPADVALRAWMAEFVQFLATKRGMATALKAAPATDDVARLEAQAQLTAAIATLLQAGAEAGRLRPDADALDVLMALGGTALIAGEPDQRAQADRLLDLLLAGLRL